jgi:hypothetical protein
MNRRAETKCYMAEVRLRIQGGASLAWIRQSLDAACARVRDMSPALRILSAVYVPDDNRLSCLLAATGPTEVHRLFEIALLPSAQVLEVVVVQPA